MRGDPGCDQRSTGVDGDGVGGMIAVGVLENHLGQGQGSRQGGGNGGANYTTVGKRHKVSEVMVWGATGR